MSYMAINLKASLFFFIFKSFIQGGNLVFQRKKLHFDEILKHTKTNQANFGQCITFVGQKINKNK